MQGDSLEAMEADLNQLAQDLGQLLSQKKLTVVTAESCTGGWIAKRITDVAGSSEWFERGYVTYSDVAKRDMLQVADTVLAIDGAVSQATALAMALGAKNNSPADCVVAVTGIAGPDGGTFEKPVGTVWIAWIINDKNDATCFRFTGDRESVRRQSVAAALEGIRERLVS